MRLSQLLKPEYVRLGLDGKNKEELMQSISKYMADVHGLDKKDVYKAISDREKKGSTGLGNGLAIPHGRSAKVSGMHLVVIYDAQGEDYEAYDKKPSHLFFAALTSEDYSPHEQLEVLRIIAEIYEKTDIASSVKNVKTDRELYELLLKKEEEII